MARYYLFFRCWPGFTKPFPFDRFNSLPDDELAKALDAYAREQLHAEKPTIKRIRRKRKRKLGERPRRIELPRRPPNTAQRQHYDYRVRGTYRRSPLICRVGVYLGWWKTSITGIIVGNQITGSRVWLLEVADQDLAEHLVAELNSEPGLDYYGRNPRFGYLASEGFSTAERASMQRQINAIRDGKQPAVEHGKALSLIEQRARQVATDAAEAWAQVAHAGATDQKELEEAVPAASGASEKSPSEQPVEAVGRKKSVKLDYWAVGCEDGRTWWLFRKGEPEWQQHGKVDIPKGNPGMLARTLADQGGAITRDEAVKLFERSHHGRSDKSLRKKVVTPALNKLRGAIKSAIARAGKHDKAAIGDPIPWDNNGSSWQAKIEIGFAVKDDERLVFRTKEQMTAETEASMQGYLK